ncbi:MAG: L-threonylcarbamoyladenylate synthase [Phormidesmis sp.]
MTQVSLSQMVEKLAAAPALVSFPTDTVPALSARPEHAELIYAAKQRSPDKPLILMGAAFADLLPYVCGDDSEVSAWQNLAQQHWPGQLTLVLPAKSGLPSALNPQNTGTLGIRVPNHPIALNLLRRTGPLATTSANLSGQPPLISPDEIARAFPDALVLSAKSFAMGAEAPISGLPSTVVKWTGSSWQILRQGKVDL